MLETSLTRPNIIIGSFILTPTTALRYERHDRKVQQMTKEAELGIGKDRRRVDINEEYYRLAAKVTSPCLPLATSKAESSCRIWTIGKTKGSKDYRAKTMGYDPPGQL